MTTNQKKQAYEYVLRKINDRIEEGKKDMDQGVCVYLKNWCWDQGISCHTTYEVKYLFPEFEAQKPEIPYYTTVKDKYLPDGPWWKWTDFKSRIKALNKAIKLLDKQK